MSKRKKPPMQSVRARERSVAKMAAMIERRDQECQHLAAQLFADTIARHSVEPGLQVHADRGSAMKSDTLAQLLASLGASRSFSRPRVSDDNAFGEAQFKTLKYQPDYPGRFESELHARAYLQDFFGWHNEEHHHSGLALFTPSDVFHGRVDQVAAVRQAALDDAHRAHPERFPNGPPQVLLPPAAVHINPLITEALHAPSDHTTKDPAPSTQTPSPASEITIASVATSPSAVFRSRWHARAPAGKRCLFHLPVRLQGPGDHRASRVSAPRFESTAMPTTSATNTMAISAATITSAILSSRSSAGFSSPRGVLPLSPSACNSWTGAPVGAG